MQILDCIVVTMWTCFAGSCMFGGGGGGVPMSVIRKGNVALSNLRNSPVALSSLRNSPVARQI